MIRSNVNPMTFPQLFTAGRARLTFRNNETDGHVTIHVKQARDKRDRKKKLPIFFINISLLDDGDQGYVFAGTYFQEDDRIRASRNAPKDSRLWKMLGFIRGALTDPSLFRERNVSLLHEGRCCRCGLPLTNPESIEHGLGDDCYVYLNGSEEEKKKLMLKLEKRKA